MMPIPLQSEIVYGPIHSRRFGQSLGINLMPSNTKVCNFRCCYCQYQDSPFKGKTFFPGLNALDERIRSVMTDLHDKKQPINWIMIAGNGEPTLYPEFSKAVDLTVSLRNQYFPETSVGILSNSSTCWRETVRQALAKADGCFMKLDAGSVFQFWRLNRPKRSLAWSDVLKGLQVLNRTKRIVIQSMFVEGPFSNATPQAIDQWLREVERIRPLSVQVYTIDRPPQVSALRPVSKKVLVKIAQKVRHTLGVESNVYE